MNPQFGRRRKKEHRHSNTLQEATHHVNVATSTTAVMDHHDPSHAHFFEPQPPFKSCNMHKCFVAVLLLTAIMVSASIHQSGWQQQDVAKAMNADADKPIASATNHHGDARSVSHSDACHMQQIDQSIDDFMMPFRVNPELRSCVNPGACNCINPTIPKHRRANAEQWKAAFQATKDIAANATRRYGTVDVILLGDSITEHWMGTGMNRRMPRFRGNAQVFRQLFTKEGGGEIVGVALGIAADTCANLAYRLEHDQLQGLKTKAFWLLIGTNDLGLLQCSADATTAGILSIVEQLRRLQPNAHIVVNSLLPRKPQFMPQIHDVNRRLQCYAGSAYFDASTIFPNATLYMPDQLHPEAEGSRVWGARIVQRVREIVAE